MTDQKTPRPTPNLVPNHPVASKPVEEPKVKPQFVRKPHLTSRPFQGNEALQKMKSEMANQRPRKY